MSKETSQRLYELGVTFWRFSVGDPKSESGFHQNVRRMSPSWVPNAIVTNENYERFGEYVPHPDAKQFRIDANTECVETRLIAPREYLATGWGDTPEEAEADVIRRILALGLYTPCPRCRATRSDIDFCVEPVPHPAQLVCRICGHGRPAL